MSYLNPAEDWERLQAEQPFIAGLIASAPRSIVIPPPGVDPFSAYGRIFAACTAIWLHVAAAALLANG